MQTIFSIMISLSVASFVGLPLASLFFSKDEQQYVWILSPFLGLALIILSLQTLIYFNIPIANSYYLIWLFAGILWIVFFKKIKKIFPPPFLLLGVAFSVYLLHALGLLIIGPENYVGRAWYDQMSYTFLAQFLMEHSFHQANIHDFLWQPWAIKALIFSSTNRIGEAVYQGFIACSTFTDAKISFELSILLLPPLTVLAVYQVAQRFFVSRKMSLLVAAAGACLPSVALIHLESCLSQALIMPLLILWPCILENTFENRRWQKFIVITLLLALVISVYTEYFLIFTGLAFAYLLFRRENLLRNLGMLLIIIFFAILLNAEFINKIFLLATRSVSPRSWSNIYPWANSLESIHRLWLGDFTLMLNGWKTYLFAAISTVLFLLAYSGFLLVSFPFKKKAFEWTVLLLLLLPFVIYLISVNNFGYQFFKLLLTVSPLLPLGIVLVFHHWKLNYHFLWLGFFTSIIATLTMILTSISPVTLAYFKRGPGYKLLIPETLEVEKKLNQFSGENILIAWQDDFRNGDFINGWLNYFARRNRVWVSNYFLGDEDLKNYLPSVKSLPQHYLLLATHQSEPLTMKKIWENKEYILWKC